MTIPVRSRAAKIKVIIVDDHEVVRLGLRTALEAEPDMEIVGETGGPEEAMDLTVARRPDVVLLDVKLREEGYDGPDVCRSILARAPGTVVIMLSNYLQDATVFRSLVAGAKGFVVKDVELAELKRMIRAAHRGASILDPKITERVIARATQPEARQPANIQAEAFREVDLAIIRHLSRGLTNKEIAALIRVSTSTVKDHLVRISSILGVHARAAIVGEALKRGLI
jgi:DNA-binding NarL/FixJ family response regulator